MLCFVDSAVAGNLHRAVSIDTSTKKEVLSIGLSIAARFVWTAAGSRFRFVLGWDRFAILF
jgi:hypothetical protein